MYNQIKEALVAAMEVKQATLRPEIRLLNKLLLADGAEAWRGVLAGEDAQEQLTMNDGYFFQLLDRMVAGEGAGCCEEENDWGRGVRYGVVCMCVKVVCLRRGGDAAML